MNEPSPRTLHALLEDERFDETCLPDGTSVILDIAGQQVVSLSKTGAYIVAQVRDGADDFDDLAKRVAIRYEVDEDTARTDARQFVAELIQALSKQAAPAPSAGA
jgi:hypothetical protein